MSDFRFRMLEAYCMFPTSQLVAVRCCHFCNKRFDDLPCLEIAVYVVYFYFAFLSSISISAFSKYLSKSGFIILPLMSDVVVHFIVRLLPGRTP